jgi:hypothetical protein
LPPQAILVSDRSISKKIFSSETTWPNKPKLFFFFNKSGFYINRNLVGSIYGRSSINIAYFVLIREQTWPPQAILVFDWWFKKNNSSLKPLDQMN